MAKSKKQTDQEEDSENPLDEQNESTESTEKTTKTKKHNKNESPDEIKDSLAKTLNDSIKKILKVNGKLVRTLGNLDDETAADVKEWVSTGNDALDLIISNRPHAGLPVGRIVEITGLESSGKSLLCGHIVAEAQKMGGACLYIDTEMSMDRNFLKAIGVDLNNVLYMDELDTIEKVFETVENTITTIRKEYPNKLIVIIVDSIAGASTEVENADDYNQSGYATQKSIIISKAMRKITPILAKQKTLLVFTNQLRQKMNAMAFGDPWIAPGGKAIPFHASVRLRLSKKSNITDTKTKEVLGSIVTCEVVKSKLGPSKRKMQFNVYFDSGIDKYKSTLDVLEGSGFLKKSAGVYTLQFINPNDPTNTEEKVQFKHQDFMKLLHDRPELDKYLYDELSKVLVREYVTDNFRDYSNLNLNPDTEITE